ncbi:MAG: HEPN domain-containing protein [Chloroflexi bacterium]|nr:HEPN domain-containing protein [Chloroflexota bacterium]
MSGLPTTEELAKLLETVSDQILYDTGRSGKFTRDHLKEVSRKDKLIGGMVAAGARALLPDTLLAEILPIFRNLLRGFVDRESDRIGNGLVNLAGGVLTPVLRDYVPILIRASAILGGQRVAELLIGWIRGERVKYQTISLLNGVAIDRPLVLEEGLRLYKLPQSSNEAVSHLPAMSLDMHGLQAMVGRVALSIEGEAGPALFLPSKDAPDLNHNIEHVWAGGQIEKLSIDSFCEAMSLACGGSVRRQIFWRDFGEISEFLGAFSVTSYTNVPPFTTSNGFTQDHFEHAREIHSQRTQKGRNKAGLDTAVRRWIKSKYSESSFEDQLIDIRIALEALYLDNKEGELRFRLASHGAWYMSESTQERKENFHTLLEVYKLASSAVHGNEVKTSDNNKAILENAQTLCRKGIMKRLREQESPRWNDIIMGDGG